MKKIITNTNHWFTIFSVTAIVLLSSSFILPPTGVVDPSVIASVGELFAFAALATVIKAIDKGVDATLSKGDMQIEIKNDEDNKNEE